MRAGLLRYPIIFLQENSVQSDSGAIRKEFTTMLSTRCEKIRQSPTVGNEVNAKEVFYENTVQVRLRNNALIAECGHCLFQNRTYRIVMKDDSIKERTTTLTLKLNNV